METLDRPFGFERMDADSRPEIASVHTHRSLYGDKDGLLWLGLQAG